MFKVYKKYNVLAILYGGREVQEIFDFIPEIFDFVWYLEIFDFVSEIFDFVLEIFDFVPRKSLILSRENYIYIIPV